MGLARLQLGLQDCFVSAVELPIVELSELSSNMSGYWFLLVFIYEWHILGPECCSSSCKQDRSVSAVELPAPQLSQFSAGGPRVNTSTSKACKRRDSLPLKGQLFLTTPPQARKRRDTLPLGAAFLSSSEVCPVPSTKWWKQKVLWREWEILRQTVLAVSWSHWHLSLAGFFCWKDSSL